MADELDTDNAPDERGPRKPAESELAQHLSDWDAEMGEKLSFDELPEPEETVLKSEHDDALREFEMRMEALEGEHGELQERYESAEGLAQFTEEAINRVNQRDFDSAVQHLSSETGISSDVVILELRQKLLMDPDFAEAAEMRFDDPSRLESMISELSDDLLERHQPQSNDRGMRAAILLSRRVNSGSSNYGSESASLAGLSRGEFEKAKAEIFEDARSGRLSPGGGRSRGGFLRTSP